MQTRLLFTVLLWGSLCKPVPTDIKKECRSIPGDVGWPSKDAWDSLNGTVSGRLTSTAPVAHVCHDPAFSDADCKSVSQQWGQLPYMTSQPAEILSTWFQNESCVPYTSKARPCDLGNYPSYIIDVQGVDDIIAGLRFVQKSNVRLVIKNTGHDFFGKSTGKGALSLWMRNLKSTKLIRDYQSSYYRGPAIKLGAGVTGGDASLFASQQGYRVVAGSCPTVGIVGGYTQGGGHSFLSGVYGFGADNVLEWEVVLASGEHLVATPTQHEDLYWALSGGGGGTFGVVVSMTIRVFPEGQSAVASLSFGKLAAGSEDTFWHAVEGFFVEAQTLVDRYGVAFDFGISRDTLAVLGLLAPGVDDKSLLSLMQPMMDTLSERGISMQSANLAVKAASSYYDLWAVTTTPLRVRSALSPVLGGRMVSRSNMASNSSAVFAAIRKVVSGGQFIASGVAFNANGSSRLAAPISPNAVQPSLSEAYMTLVFETGWTLGRDWADAAHLQDQFMQDLMPILQAATPEAGVYKNEGNWAQSNFQVEFFGSTYQRLRAIKQEYDPNGVFYGVATVGSEAWAPDGQGRLCKTGSQGRQ